MKSLNPITGAPRAFGTVATAPSGTLTPTGDSSQNFYSITAQSAALTVAAPSGTALDGNNLLLRVKDNGTARAITWNAIYRAKQSLTLPTTTVVGQHTYIMATYNSADTKWDVLGVSQV